MKKMEKAKKTKIIENAKTIVIVLLFLSCVFFGSKIFETYREQTMGDSLLSQKNSSNLSQTSNNVTKESVVSDFAKFSEPFVILANGENSRAVVSRNLEEFDLLSSAGLSLVKAVYSLSSDNIFDAAEDEWESALRRDSVYFKYPESRLTWFEKDIYQAKGDIAERIKSYSEILIMPVQGSACEVFFRDKLQKTFLKVKVNAPEVNAIRDILKKYESYEEKDCDFAWEQSLDEGNFDSTVLESMMILPKNETVAREIVTNITRNYRQGLNFTKSTEFASGLIGIFGYNPNTVRQYVSNDDSLIFVGETGSLSVSPEGKIEYKALDAKEGILLAPDNDLRPSAVLSGLTNITERIFELSGLGKETREFDIKFTKMPRSMGQKFEICFDYFVDGKKVVFSDTPAIYATVDRGVLVELKMEVKDIQMLENKSLIDSVFMAIDRFEMKNQKEHAEIDGQLVYRCGKNGEKIEATWDILRVR